MHVGSVCNLVLAAQFKFCIHLRPLQQIQLRYKQTWGQMEQGTTQQVCLHCLIEKGGN